LRHQFLRVAMDDKSPVRRATMEPQQATASAPVPERSSGVGQPIERLLAENEELRRQIHLLTLQQTHLVHRVQRLEDSHMFRFLRWLGGRLLDLPPWLQRLLPIRGLIAPGGVVSYSEWIQQTNMMELIEKLAERQTVPEPLALVSVIVWNATNTEELASLSAQSYPTREVYFCDAQSTAAFQAALAKCRSEFTAVVSANAVLEPEAIQRWVDAATRDVGLVYSDWDHLDENGQRHTPRFTPEFSPALLEHTLYFGGCFLARTEMLRTVAQAALEQPVAEQSSEPQISPVLHQFALAASRRGSVVRVPKMLWHQMGPVIHLSTKLPDAPLNARDYTASIIICTRSPELIRKCLRSLRPTIDSRTEIVVVNHEIGTPNGVEQIAAGFGAKVVPYRGAFHFGLMNEIGAQAAKGSLLVFLNDDVYPITPNWLDQMAAQALRDDVGPVGALLYYPSGKIQHAGVVVGGMPGATHIGRFLRQSQNWPWLTLTRDVTAVTGACLAIRRQVWDELGGFDPRFPVNYNDADLCLRARRLGYRVVLEARAALTHEESQTRPAGVRPEELALFASLWGDVLERHDPYFHPELTIAARDMHFRSPSTRLQ
jgi:O-antigen biosynthesis protein